MHGYPPFFAHFLALPFFGVFLAALLLWTLLIKGYALWRAARNSQKGWYIALLVVNSLGILEIVYLIWFAKHDASVVPSSTPEQH